MAIDDYKFIETDFENQGITELPDRPSEGGITASQLKARFDNIPKIIMALGKINNFFDFLKSGEASSDIGATAVKTGGSETVQGVLEELQAQATSIESNAVHKSGNETIDDVKTFTSSPVVPTPTANTHPATKKYVDDKDAAVVHKTGNETVNGVKNFTDSIYVSSFTIRDNGNTGEIIGGTAEDKLAFLQGDLKFNDDLVWTAGNDGTGSGLDADTLDGKQDADMVHKAGAETITGVKTFSASPVVPTPTADGNPATKKYADDIASARYTKTNMQTSGQALLHWGNLTNVPNLADNHWKTPVANQAALPVTGNALGDNRVVLDDGDGKQAVYTCVATTGTYTQQWSKVGDVDWMTEEATRQTQETARVNAEGTESPKSGRVGAEIDRVAAENARILAEGTADPKTGRIGAELDRVDAENARKSAEILRQAHINDKDNPHEVTAAKAGALSTTDAGDLAKLTTTEKGSLVGAINEVDMSLNETQQLVSTNVGDLETLTTTDKSSLVNATNEVKDLVDTNKTNIATHDQKLTNIEMRFGTYDIVDTGGSPGNVRLLAGKPNAGFFGFVQPSEMGLITANAPANQAYSGANLALALGLSAGIAFNSDVPLMKFHYKGKILYVPLTGYRYNLFWDGIYAKGIVFDTADEGFLPPAGRCGTNLIIDASDNSINCTTQNFLGDKSAGMDYADTVGAVGDTLVLKGWTDESNNATVTISSITNTKIIVTGATLVSESGGKTSRFYNTKNAVTQGKTVEIGDKTYKVYLIRGSGDNPTDSYSDADRGAAGANNMWNSLILPLHEHAKLGNWTYPAYAVDASGTKITADWGFGLTDADLRTHNSYGSGSYAWCQENLNTTAWRRVLRGYLGASYLDSDPSWYYNSHYCWRPVLESL